MQAFLVGCSFDNFSSDNSSRSYIWVLILLAWLAPMIFIAIAYFSIMGAVKSEAWVGRCGGTPSSVADQQRQKVSCTWDLASGLGSFPRTLDVLRI